MSETIDYWGIVRNYKPEEKIEIIELIEEFQDATIEYDVGDIEFSVASGWRGGGYSCEELIGGHFGEYMKKHPHIELEVIATYIEHAPSQTINIKGEKIECIDSY